MSSHDSEVKVADLHLASLGSIAIGTRVSHW